MRKPFRVAIYAVTVGPVAFGRDEREAVVLDQALGDLHSPRVELGRPVRRLAEQDELRVADEVDQRVEVARGFERTRDLAQPVNQLLGGGRVFETISSSASTQH